MFCLQCGSENKLSAHNCISCNASLKDLDSIVLSKTSPRNNNYSSNPREMSAATEKLNLIKNFDFDSLAEEFLQEIENDPKNPRGGQKVLSTETI